MLEKTIMDKLDIDVGIRYKIGLQSFSDIHELTEVFTMSDDDCLVNKHIYIYIHTDIYYNIESCSVH